MNLRWERLANGVHRTRLPFLDVTVGLVDSSAGALLVDSGTTLTEAAAIDAEFIRHQQEWLRAKSRP